MVEGYGLAFIGLLPLSFHLVSAYNCWKLSWIPGSFFTWRVGWAMLCLSCLIYASGRIENVLSIASGAQINWYRFMTASMGAFTIMFFTICLRQIFRNSNNAGAPEARRPTAHHG